jgi:hypothetical protein
MRRPHCPKLSFFKKEVAMARIKIKDIPKDQKIEKEELKRIRGGTFSLYTSNINYSLSRMDGDLINPTYTKEPVGTTTFLKGEVTTF